MDTAAERRARPRPRLVFVNRYYAPDLSASSQMLTGIAEALAACGFRVEVVCSRQSYEDPHAGFGRLEVRRGVTARRVHTTRFGRARLAGRAVDYLSFYFMAALELLRVVRRGDVIVAKTDPPLLSVLCAIVARVTGAKLINWLQDLFPEVAVRLALSPLPGWAEHALARLRDWSLRAAAMNIVLGERMRAVVAARGIARERILVAPNWADGNAIRPVPTAASRLRQELGWNDRFVVEYSGNFGRAHEFETLLGAAKAVAADPAYAFLMIGGGVKMRGLELEAHNAGLDSFRFLGYQPLTGLADSLAAGDVHVVSLLPALEGLIVPSKLYGILAAGRPVIFVGERDGEVAEVLREAGCGITVGVGDIRGLSAAIERLRHDAETRRQMADRAREAFDRRYTLAASVAAWNTMLKALEPRAADAVDPPELAERLKGRAG
jgi:glycosyltransferase involved in cell wall biosynthesis